MTCMLSHICCQDHVYNTLASILLLLLREFFEEVEIRSEQEFDRFRCMPVFLNGNVMEAQRPIRHEIYMVGIIVAVVFIIVTSTGCDCRDHIQVVQ